MLKKNTIFIYNQLMLFLKLKHIKPKIILQKGCQMNPFPPTANFNQKTPYNQETTYSGNSELSSEEETDTPEKPSVPGAPLLPRNRPPGTQTGTITSQRRHVPHNSQVGGFSYRTNFSNTEPSG